MYLVYEFLLSQTKNKKMKKKWEKKTFVVAVVVVGVAVTAATNSFGVLVKIGLYTDKWAGQSVDPYAENAIGWSVVTSVDRSIDLPIS